MNSLGMNEVYIDHLIGKSANRPELQRLMEYVRQGDTVIVASISRFARNTRDLKFDKVTARWRKGELTAADAMRRLGMSKTTFYRRVQ